ACHMVFVSPSWLKRVRDSSGGASAHESRRTQGMVRARQTERRPAVGRARSTIKAFGTRRRQVAGRCATSDRALHTPNSRRICHALAHASDSGSVAFRCCIGYLLASPAALPTKAKRRCRPALADTLLVHPQDTN